MTTPDSTPRVLAVTEDAGFLRALRIDMPLVNLKKQGLISEYFVTNPSLFDVPDQFVFDVIWVHRVRDRKFVGHLIRLVHGAYLYDIDDLMIGCPSFIPPEELCNKDVIAQAMKNCGRLAVTSTRLAHSLEKMTGIPLMDKVMVCPNALEFSSGLRIPTKPSGLLLTQSDRLALSDSYGPVTEAVREFCRKHDLPIYYFGTLFEGLANLSNQVFCFGRIPFWHYHSLLAALPSMLGIAPLETSGDAKTLNFVNCKSDIKMLDYAGFGHPSVYSNAAPFVDTDLKAGLIVENSRTAWFEGLERVYRDLWRNLADEQESVIRLRNMDKVAVECWYEVINSVRMSRLMKGKQIKFASGLVNFAFNASRHMVFSQDHEFRRRLKDNLPPLLTRLLRKFVMKQ